MRETRPGNRPHRGTILRREVALDPIARQRLKFVLVVVILGRQEAGQERLPWRRRVVFQCPPVIRGSEHEDVDAGQQRRFDFFDHPISGRKEARLRSQSEARVQRLEAIVGGPGIQRGVDDSLKPQPQRRPLERDGRPVLSVADRQRARIVRRFDPRHPDFTHFDFRPVVCVNPVM